MLRRAKKSRLGQTLVEYALILAFVSVITISILAALGRGVSETFSRVSSNLSSAMASH